MEFPIDPSAAFLYDDCMFNIENYLRRGIGTLKPYIPGRSEEEIEEIYGVSSVVKLASNENPNAPADGVIAAIAREAARINRYPDGRCRRLARRLATRLKCREDELIFGNGAEELIQIICQAFVNEGDACLLVAHTFDAYETGIRIMGGVPVFSPLDGMYRVDLKEMARRITSGTKLLFLPNPNNPTGTVFTREAFEAFLRELPPHVVVVLDEAYHEYVMDPDYPDGQAYIGEEFPLIVLRTFSKAYGLAGARIGYAIAHASIIKALHRVRLPFNVNRLAEMAALTVLDQGDWYRRGLEEMRAEKEFLYASLRDLGIFFVPSETNFIFMDIRMSADRFCDELLRKGLIVRPGTIWGFDTFIRLTVGTRMENEKFLTELKARIH